MEELQILSEDRTAICSREERKGFIFLSEILNNRGTKVGSRKDIFARHWA